MDNEGRTRLGVADVNNNNNKIKYLVLHLCSVVLAYSFSISIFKQNLLLGLRFGD